MVVFFARVGREEKESESVNYDDDLHELAQTTFPDFLFSVFQAKS